MANQYCGDCIHYNQRSYLICTGQKNVSGGSVWYRVWSRFIGNLPCCRDKQGFKCASFEGNEDFVKHQKELQQFRKELEEFCYDTT